MKRTLVTVGILLCVVAWMLLRARVDEPSGSGSSSPHASTREHAGSGAQSAESAVDDATLARTNGASTRGAVEQVHDGHVRGRVTTRDGEPLASRAWVLAYPSDETPSRRRLARALQTDGNAPGIQLVKADASGAFDVGGLDRARTYALMAGGGGSVTKQALGPIAVGAEDVVLSLDHVYAAQLRFVERDGSALLSDGTLWQPGSPTSWGDIAGAGEIEVEGIQALLAGVRALPEPGAWPANVLLYVSSRGEPEIGPVTFAGQLAGYQAFQAPIVLKRMSDKLPQVEVKLERLFDALASMSVHWELPPDFSSAALDGRSGQDARLLLRSAVDSTTFEYRIHSLSRNATTIHGVPYGDYIVTLDMPLGFHVLPTHLGRTPIRIAEDDARVEFDLGAMPCIELDVVRKDGAHHQGPIQLRTSALKKGEWVVSTVLLTEAPYALNGLLPTRYVFTLDQPFVSDDQNVDFSNQGGEAPRQKLVFDENRP